MDVMFWKAYFRKLYGMDVMPRKLCFLQKKGLAYPVHIRYNQCVIVMPEKQYIRFCRTIYLLFAGRRISGYDPVWKVRTKST